MDHIVRRAISLGADPILAVKAATYNAARHFSLRGRGAVAPGYRGDLVLIDNFTDFTVEQVWRGGVPVLTPEGVPEGAPPGIDPRLEGGARRTFHVGVLSPADFSGDGWLPVIGMVAGEITTVPMGRSDRIDPARDILKAAVVERHRHTGAIGLGFLKGYGLKEGAVATSVSHDAHNIIVVGTSEAEMAAAANRVIALKGGIVVWRGDRAEAEVALPIAGIMSDQALPVVNEQLERAKARAHGLGLRRGIDPFMTLSFMALPVIPSLRLTTGGVFDVTAQRLL